MEYTLRSVPKFSNFVDLLAHARATFADKPLFGRLVDDALQWMTYAEFGVLVDRMRAGFHKLGIKPGDTIAIISNNRVEWAVGVHAAYGLGARIVPMYESQQRGDWQYVLADCDASVCLVPNNVVAERLAPLQKELPKLREVVIFEAPIDNPNSYAALYAYGAEHPVPARVPAGDEIGVVMYTSGTTGKPKGALLSQRALAMNVWSLVSTAQLTPEERACSFLPWSHIFGGCVELNAFLLAGVPSVIVPDPMLMQLYLPKVQPTVVFGVPRLWSKVYDSATKFFGKEPMFIDALHAGAKIRAGETPTQEEQTALDTAKTTIFPLILGALGGKLKYAASGAARLPREVGDFLDTLGLEVWEAYGMTETGGVAACPRFSKIRLGSVGRAMPEMRVEIDTSVPGGGPGEGEIIFYGPGVMTGYINQPEATAAILTKDGGVRTGDIGHVDEDGFLFITGRVKDLYKLENGRYVAPTLVEETLSLSPYILQSVVYGAGKSHNVALIVPDLQAVGQWAKEHGIEGEGTRLFSVPDVLALFESEVDKANRKLKDFERVKRFVIEPEELSTRNGMLTETAKLKRAPFNNKYGAVLEGLYPRGSEAPARRASYIEELQPAISAE